MYYTFEIYAIVFIGRPLDFRICIVAVVIAAISTYHIKL